MEYLGNEESQLVLSCVCHVLVSHVIFVAVINDKNKRVSQGMFWKVILGCFWKRIMDVVYE